MNFIRKIFFKAITVLAFLGEKLSKRTSKPIIKYGYRGGRWNVDSTKDSFPQEQSATYVAEGWTRPEIAHHREKGKEYTATLDDGTVISKKSWTQEEWNKAKLLKEKGYSYYQIATKLGRTYSSVQGKFLDMKDRKNR